METIKEKTNEYIPYLLNPNYMIPLDIIDGQLKDYTTIEKEQEIIIKEVILKRFTTDELKAELKRRNAEKKTKEDSILRCRMCKHWGEINYWGKPVDYNYGSTQPCKFFKTKNGKYYRCHRASDLACEHFERKEE